MRLGALIPHPDHSRASCGSLVGFSGILMACLGRLCQKSVSRYERSQPGKHLRQLAMMAVGLLPIGERSAVSFQGQ